MNAACSLHRMTASVRSSLMRRPSSNVCIDFQKNIRLINSEKTQKCKVVFPPQNHVDYRFVCNSTPGVSVSRCVDKEEVANIHGRQKTVNAHGVNTPCLTNRPHTTFAKANYSNINKPNCVSTPFLPSYKNGQNRKFSTSAAFAKEDNIQVPDMDLINLNPRDFSAFLKSKGIRRCFLAKSADNASVVCSHPELESLKDFFINDTSDYHGHEAVFLELGKRTGCLFGGFVWRTMRGQAHGGIRLWEYKTMERFLRDGLRLSAALGEKASLAGLWVGGGKGIISMPDEKRHLQPDFRSKIFYDFGDFLTSLNGCLVGGLGLGTAPSDMDNINLRSRYTTCMSTDRGGVGNPSRSSGRGIICAIQAALDFLKMGMFDGKVVAIQGAGNAAVALINELLDRKAKHIYVTDVHNVRVQDVKDMFHVKGRGRLSVEKVPLESNAILEFPCDILSPCALGNILNKDTIPRIQAKIVCGSANNQLSHYEDNELLAERGITYIPDFLANRMALVKSTHEPYGRLTDDDPEVTKHFDREWPNSIYAMTKKILKKSREQEITPAMAAVEIAEHLSNELHPIYPYRSRDIINALIQSEWHLDKSIY